MSLIETLRNDMITATKAGTTDTSTILKMAISSVKNAQINSQEPLKDSDVENILRKEVKKIQDSITQYTTMGRQDLVEKEKIQLEILSKYLPQLMTESEVEDIVKKKIEELGAKDRRDMGRVMGAVMKELAGKADGNTVKNVVEKTLS